MIAPDPDEAVMDELVAAGHAPADWRDRQAALRLRLRTLPARSLPPGTWAGSGAILADREETGERGSG